MTATEEARPSVPAVRRSELFVGGRWSAAEHGRTVLSIIEADGTDHAVEIANEYGLSASVFSRDAAAALEEFTELRWITVQSGPRHYPF